MKAGSWISALSLDSLAQYSVVYFVSQAYSFSSIGLALDHAQKSMGMRYRYLSPSQEGIEQQLAISFLGDRQWYWLGSLDLLPAQQATIWKCYLEQYEGPHVIWCHTQEPVATQKNLVITLPEAIDYDEFVALAHYFFPQISAQRCALFQSIFQDRKRVPCDFAYTILLYAQVLSVQHVPLFIREWVNVILAPEHSLFTMSTLFFAKDISSFLSLWMSIKNSYSSHFWISYWSDQLFRAYNYRGAKQSQDGTLVKKYAHRLPFSFTQRDWKKHSTQSLSSAHRRLYELDFSFKQGGDEQFLDLWVYEFLTC
jgi:hypothetical protein